MSKINVGRIAFHPPRVFVRGSIRLLYLGNHGGLPFTTGTEVGLRDVRSLL